MPTTDPDHLRTAILVVVAKHGWTANELSIRCGGSPTPECVSRYLRGKTTMNSSLLADLCQVLGLELRPAPRTTNRPA